MTPADLTAWGEAVFMFGLSVVAVVAMGWALVNLLRLK